jgi:hypothetical protein
MEIDVFPVVTSGVPLDTAFGTMTHLNRSAMVVDSGPLSAARYAFVEAADVVFAMSDGVGKVEQPLTSRTPLRLLRPMDLGLQTFIFGVSEADGALERHFAQFQDDLVLLAVTGTRAVVASRHEYKMPEQATPKDCYCTLDRKPVSPGKNHGDCPHDRRHSGAVRCR